MRRIIVAAAASLCVSVLGPCFGQTSPAAVTRIETRIPPQALGSALKEFAESRHTQVLYFAAEVKGLRTPGASGDMTADETLRRLLRGTGLQYRYVDIDAVSILPVRTGVGATDERSAPVVREQQRYATQDRKSKPVSSATDPPQVLPQASERRALRKHKREILQEVTITGTHIKGATPAYPVTTITRTEILQSGLPTINDVLRASPEVFSGGMNPGAIQVGAAFNPGDAGTGISNANLLGIGNSDTLTLIDGRRLAGAGIFSSSSADLSMIPTVAVQSIQLQTGGSSAIYGSDAVAGVVNIVLRKHFSGEETSGYVGWTQEGGGFTQRYSQLFGRSVERGSILLAAEFDKADPISADERAISRAAGTSQLLEPAVKSDSVLLDTSYSITDRLQGYVMGLYSHRAAFYSTQTEAFPSRVDEFDSNGGITYQAPGGDTIGIDLTDSGFAQVRDITFPPCPCSAFVEAVQNGLFGLDLHGTASVFRLPSGALRTAFGVGFRRENFDIEGNNQVPQFGSRRVSDGYIEANVPLVRDSASRLGLEELRLTGAVRYDRYSDFGSATSPTVGVVYTPLHRVTLKATYAKSFHAPTLFDLYNPVGLVLFPGAFFTGASPGSTVLYEFGGNRRLGPETAHSLTTTLTVAPRVPHLIGDLHLAATYYYIKYSDRVNSPILNVLQALVDPLVQPFVVRSPTAAQQDFAAAAAGGIRNPLGLPYDPSNVSALLEDYSQNISDDIVHGVNATVSYDVQSSLGDFTATWGGTWLRFDERLVENSAPEQISGTVFNPPNLKMRASLGWRRSGWSAITFVDRVSPEQLLFPGTQVAPVDIGAWTTVDAQIGYAIAHGSSGRPGANVAFSVTNLLNTAPPGVSKSAFLEAPVGFDPSNASAVGRGFGLSVAVQW